MKGTTLLPDLQNLVETTFKLEKREIFIVQFHDITANEYSTNINAERS